MVNELRRIYGQPGQVTTLKNSYTWNAINPSQGNVGTNGVTVYITNRENGSNIRIEQNMSNSAGMIFGGIGGGVGMGLVVVPGLLIGVSPLLGVAAISTWLGGVYWRCRKFFKSSVTKAERKLIATLDSLVEIAEGR